MLCGCTQINTNSAGVDATSLNTSSLAFTWLQAFNLAVLLRVSKLGKKCRSLLEYSPNEYLGSAKDMAI
jgi:hypothetical protein